jgi:hypothetical protein
MFLKPKDLENMRAKGLVANIRLDKAQQHVVGKPQVGFI